MTTVPWWSCLILRPEIADAGGNINDVQMSLFSAVYESGSTEYAEVGYYSDITHPTTGLLELMGAVAVRLAAPTNGGAVKAVWRGDQGMGGGKSHAEVGLFHMAKNPSDFFSTQLGKRVLEQAETIAGEAVPPTLNEPTVVVLPCDRMDPFQPDKDQDNIAETLGERWLWRLVDGDLKKYKDYRGGLGTPDGIKAAIESVGGTVLTLVDEVLSYIRKATAHAEKQDRAQQDMAFLRDLMDATNTSDHCALVIVMIASDDDQVAMGDFGERIRTEMEGMLIRFGRSIATTSGGDFAEIIRRRLFVQPPPTEVLNGIVSDFKQHVIGGWREQFETFGWWTDGFDRNVARAYPFHPALIDLVEREWANRAGFQRVRSTIQIFAAAVHTWFERAEAEDWAPPLIGIGDLPLSDTKVRQSILDSGVIPDAKLVANYREIAANDVVNSGDDRGAARRIDAERAFGLLTQINPRAAERIATSMYLGSLAPRSQGAVGVTDAELRVAGFVPAAACDLAEIDAVLTMLESPDRGIATLDVKPGKGGQPRRLLMSTTQTLQMFFRTQRQSVMPEDVAKVLRDVAQVEMSKGPFGNQRFVSTDGYVNEGEKAEDLTNGLMAALESAGIDEDTSRHVVLDPTQFTLLNGVDSETRAAISAALGLRAPEGWPTNKPWPTPMSVVYASSCVFAVVNTQRRKPAVAAATDFVAWRRVCEIANVSSDPGLLQQAESQQREKREAVRINLRKAYQHIVYLGDGRQALSARLDKDNQTALDGTIAWKTLSEKEKAFDKGEFDRVALLHNLRENDYSRSLSAIRADFYRSPRLPLLYDGDTDLRNAIYAAIQAGEVEILNQSGEAAVPSRPGDINVTSNALILDRPKLTDPEPSPEPGTAGPSLTNGEVGPVPQGGGATATSPPSSPSNKATPAISEKRIVLTFMGSAFNDEDQTDAGYKLFSAIATALDRGQVSYGTFQIDITVPSDVAIEIDQLSTKLGVDSNLTDV